MSRSCAVTVQCACFCGRHIQIKGQLTTAGHCAFYFYAQRLSQIKVNLQLQQPASQSSPEV